MGTNFPIFTRATKLVLDGFPAKWLIFSSIMLLPAFYFGTYFAPSLYMDVLFLAIMERYWSTKIVVRNTQCTWTLILNYNVNKLASLKLWKLTSRHQI